jgi:hypothetical protein
MDANGRMYIAVGDQNANQDGEVYYSDDPFAVSPSYVDMGFNETSRRIVGVGVGEDGSSNPVVLAWVNGTGIRRAVSGTPEAGTKYADTTQTTTQQQAYFFWAGNTGADVYCYFPRVGLLHSGDYGDTWTLRNSTRTTTTRRFGHASQDTTPTTIYVTTDNGAWRFDDVDTASPTETSIGGSMSEPGPTAVASNGDLWIVDEASPTQPPRLWQSDNQGGNFTDLADDYFRANIILVWGKLRIADRSDGDFDLYFNTDGLGTLWGIAASGITVAGVGFSPILSFPQGTVTSSQRLDGDDAAFVPALSFPAGSLTQNVTGDAVFAPTLSMPSGALATVLGGDAVFAPTLSMPSGEVKQFIQGDAVFAPTLSMPDGSLTFSVQNVDGDAVFAPTLAFPAGQLILNVTADAVFAPGLTFAAGSINLYVQGDAVFAPTLAMPDGSLTFGNQYITGDGVLAPALAFPAGSITQYIQGDTQFTPALSMPAGAVTFATQQIDGDAVFAPVLVFPAGQVKGPSMDLWTQINFHRVW